MAGLSEEQFQAQVVQVAKSLGWMVYHTFDSRRSASGFPDLVLVHPVQGVLFRELKTVRGVVSAAQRRWLVSLVAAGADAGVWRPSDWDDVVLPCLRGVGQVVDDE